MYNLYDYFKRSEPQVNRKRRAINDIVSKVIASVEENARVAFDGGLNYAYILALTDISERDDIKIDDECWNMIKDRLREAVEPFELVEEYVNDIKTLKIMWR